MKLDNGSSDYANELNKFYCRFDKEDHTSDLELLSETIQNNHMHFECPSVTTDDVVRVFGSLKGNKACGPDHIKGNVLKLCKWNLSCVFTEIFNWSLYNHHIPVSWKTSEIVPVPKKKNVKEMNDLRPIALTSIVMKCMEKLVKSFLKRYVHNFEDPMQFAYQEGKGVEDAQLTFTNNIYKHLETPGAYVRILFVDFSSAFNTIQPHLIVSKLIKMKCNSYLISWIMDFLIKRPQYVKIRSNDVDIKSSILHTSTGAPQGCVLSPLLFTIYTSDCRSSFENVIIIKFADDAALQGLITSVTDLCNYFSTISYFSVWCAEHNLDLNVIKTKEMVIDFRTSKAIHEPVVIKGNTIQQTDTYKYLGVLYDNNLSWYDQGFCVINKINQRLYFIRKLNQLHVEKTIITMFYTSTMESIISFCLIIYGGNLNCSEQNKINSVISRVEKITNMPLSHFKDILLQLILKKINIIKAKQEHPLHNEIRTSTRKPSLVLYPKIRTERYRNSFLPTALRVLNTNAL